MSELQVDFTDQVVQFLCSVICGALIAVIYDIVAAFRTEFCWRRGAVFVADTLFGVAAALITYCFCLGWCRGEVRFFALFGEGVGWVLYRVLIHRAVRKVLALILRFFRRCSRPIGLLFRRCAEFVKKTAQKLMFRAKKHLKTWRQSLYNQTRIRRRKRGKKNEQVQE